jgi:hypothetical protein
MPVPVETHQKTQKREKCSEKDEEGRHRARLLLDHLRECIVEFVFLIRQGVELVVKT